MNSIPVFGRDRELARVLPVLVELRVQRTAFAGGDGRRRRGHRRRLLAGLEQPVETQRAAGAGRVDAVFRRQHRDHEHDGRDDQRGERRLRSACAPAGPAACAAIGDAGAHCRYPAI